MYIDYTFVDHILHIFPCLQSSCPPRLFPQRVCPPRLGLKNHDLKNHDLKNHDLKDHDLKDHDLKNHDLKDHDLKDRDLKERDLKDHDQDWSINIYHRLVWQATIHPSHYKQPSKSGKIDNSSHPK